MITPATCSPAPVHRPVSGDDVVTTFLVTVDEHGAPASTLTDNGRVYTARFGGGRGASNRRPSPSPQKVTVRPVTKCLQRRAFDL